MWPPKVFADYDDIIVIVKQHLQVKLVFVVFFGPFLFDCHFVFSKTMRYGIGFSFIFFTP